VIRRLASFDCTRIIRIIFKYSGSGCIDSASIVDELFSTIATLSGLEVLDDVATCFRFCHSEMLLTAAPEIGALNFQCLF
jgi:hypothetical protein